MGALSQKPTNDLAILVGVRPADLAARSLTVPGSASSSDRTRLLEGIVKSETSCERNHKLI